MKFSDGKRPLLAYGRARYIDVARGGDFVA